MTLVFVVTWLNVHWLVVPMREQLRLKVDRKKPELGDAVQVLLPLKRTGFGVQENVPPPRD